MASSTRTPVGSTSDELPCDGVKTASKITASIGSPGFTSVPGQDIARINSMIHRPSPSPNHGPGNSGSQPEHFRTLLGSTGSTTAVPVPTPDYMDYSQNSVDTGAKDADQASGEACSVAEGRRSTENRPLGLKALIREAKKHFNNDEAKELRRILHSGIQRGTYDLVLGALTKRYEDIENTPWEQESHSELPGACTLFFVIPKAKEVKTPSIVRAEGAFCKGELKSITTTFSKQLVLSCIQRSVVAFNMSIQVAATYNFETGAVSGPKGTVANLKAEFPGLLALCIKQFAREEQMNARNLKNPLYRFLFMLLNTSVICGDSTGQTRDRIQWPQLEVHLRELLKMKPSTHARGSRKRKHGAETPQNRSPCLVRDRGLQALLQAFVPKLSKAVRESLASHREKVHTFFFRHLAARAFLCDVFQDDPGFKMTVSPTEDEASEETDKRSLFSRLADVRLRNVLTTRSYNQRDSVGNLRALPKSRKDLRALLTNADIQANRAAFQKLQKAYPEFKVVTQTRAYRYKNTQGCTWNMPQFRQVARSGELCLRQSLAAGASYEKEVLAKLPKHYHPTSSWNLHALALTMLSQQVGISCGNYIDSENVFLAGSTDSLLAVHALALTLYAVLRKHTGHTLTREESAHCGPISLYHNTDGSDARKGRVGLIGLRTKPHELPVKNENGDNLQSQFERVEAGLPAAAFKIVRDEVFTPESTFAREWDMGMAMLENDPNWKGYKVCMETGEHSVEESENSWSSKDYVSSSEIEEDADRLLPEDL